MYTIKIEKQNIFLKSVEVIKYTLVFFKINVTLCNE